MNPYEVNRMRQYLLIIGIVVILVLVGWLAYSLSHQGPLMEISDSGSSEQAPWNLTVNNNGGGTLTCFKGHQPCKDTSYKSGTFPAVALKKDLASTDLSGYKDNCLSYAYISTDTLIYKKTRTTGINCYIITQTTPLASDLKKVYLILFP